MRYLLLPLLVVILDTICIISAAFFSIYIRFEDTAIAQKYLEMLISQLPIAVVGITVEPQNCFPVFRVKERYDDGLSFEDYK